MYSEEERVGDLEMILDEDLHAELADMVMGNCGGCDDNNVNVMMPNPSGTDFDAMGTATNTITAGREIWQVDERAQRENLLDVNDSSAAIFYDDQFPVLPDFSCMSSSSSSSSTPAPTKPIHAPSASSASTSSSAASWALLRSDGEEDVENKTKAAVPSSSGGAALSSTLSMEGFAPSDGGDTIDCMDVMENFGYMDLLDSNEIWDPSCIFDQNPQEVLQQLDDDQSKQLDVHNHQQEQPPPPPPVEFFIQDDGNGNSSSEVVQDDKRPLDEMGEVFFQWLKSHKDTISAEDMRNIKIKRSTVESATKRLGSSKEGQKQLLKLILDWVGQYQLRKKSEAAAAAAAANQLPCPNYQEPPPPPQTFPNPNPIPNYNYNTHVPTADPNSCFSSQPWIPPAPPMQPYMADPTANVMSAPPPPFPYISCDPYNPAMNFPNPYNHGEYQMLDSSQPWNQSQMTMTAASASQYPNPYPDMGHNLPPGMPLGAAYVAHDQQYPYPPMYAGNGDQMFMRLGASATKEARKKRMARQRRLAWNHPRHQQQQNHQNQANFENCQNQNPGNWGYWPPTAVAASGVSTLPMIVPPQTMDVQPQAQAQQVDRSSMQQNGHKQTSPEKRQGLKSEKNLKFLLQKVLKQSDVGNLGRIVLPKKEAETHLPELETRDGISISMEDIGTSRVWNMRYRFWPNNKSRMYLLENTGDFVKANELQEGDFIVLYSDMKCGKYLIRGVKVRQPGTKPEGKKPAKRNQRNASQGGNGTPSSPSKKQQKEKQKQTAGGEHCNWKQKQTGGETCN